MRPVDREAFRRSVRRLDERSLARLVAATWRARGATATVDGDGVTVSDGDGTRRFRAVCGWWATRRLGRAGDADADADVDAFVVDRAVEATPEGVDVVDPDDLREQLLYAVPRDAGRDVAEKHLGEPLLVADADPAPPLRARLPTPDVPAAERLPSSAGAVVGTLAVLVLVASVGGVWGGDGAGDPALSGALGGGGGAAPNADAGGDARVAGAGGDAVETAETATATRTPETDSSGSGSGSAFPPGLGPDGITDPYRLAGAHADAVTGRSYTLMLTYAESVNGTTTSRRTERVSVASPTNYATNVTGEGAPAAEPPVVADVEAYADGEVRWERRIRGPPSPGGGVYDRTPVRGPGARHGYYADRVEHYLGWYLSVEDSVVADAVEQSGDTYYWVRLGTDSYAGTENASGRALITDEGAVIRLERTYETPDAPNATATVRLVYTNRGDAPVPEPPWVATARNATAGTGSADGANATVETAEATDEANATVETAEATDEANATTETAEATGEANATATATPTPTAP